MDEFKVSLHSGLALFLDTADHPCMGSLEDDEMLTLHTSAQSIFIMLKCCINEQQLFMWRVQKTTMTICLVHDYSRDYTFLLVVSEV